MAKDEYYKPELEKPIDFAPQMIGGVTEPKKDAQELKNIVNPVRITASSLGTLELPIAPKLIHIYGPNCFGIWTQDGSDSIQFTGSPMSASAGLRGLVFSVVSNRLIITANPSSLTYSFYLQ